MKICALYIVWFDGIELLPFSINQIKDAVDEVIIIYSDTSNYGQTINYEDVIEPFGTLVNWEPDQKKQPAVNEMEKRNFALRTAKALGFTHFIMMDCDEIYEKQEFIRAKEEIESRNLAGMVCPIKVYITPTLRCDDHTLVPFIHKLTPGLKFTFNNKDYPFAYDSNGAHIDPTRRLNITSGVEMADFPMHHFSHVRRNIDLKIENSTARNNLRKSTIKDEIANAKAGYYSQFYRKILKQVPNQFGITL